jgi:hypothetical protein
MIRPLPQDVEALLAKLKAPKRLKMHLMIVHDVAVSVYMNDHDGACSSSNHPNNPKNFKMFVRNHARRTLLRISFVFMLVQWADIQIHVS